MSGDPKDWPRLKCPDCNKESLVTYGSVLCEVLDCAGPAVRISSGSGGGLTVPIVRGSEGRHQRDPAIAYCTYTDCEWTGPINNAKLVTGTHEPYNN